MKQSRAMSLVEAVSNVFVGYGVAVLTQIMIFPVFGLHTTLCQRRRKIRPRGGAKSGQWRDAKRHGACAPRIAGACHGALARRGNLAGCGQVVASVFRARLWPSR